MSQPDSPRPSDRPRLREGEPWAWALGLLALLGLAVPIGLFSDLNTVCGPTLAGTSPPDATTPTILWLELAGLRGRAPAVLDALRSRGVLQCARMAIGADGMFIVVYGAGLLLATFLVARAWELAGHPRRARRARWSSLLVLVAIGCDFAENFGMLALLRDPPELGAATRTGWSAGLKFAALALALSFLAVGGVRVAWQSWRRHLAVALTCSLVGLAAATAPIAIGLLIAQAWATMPGR